MDGGDRKKAAMLIVGGMPPPDKLGKGGGDEPADDDSGSDEGAMGMADLRAALASKDDAAAFDAFRDLVKMCGGYGK